MSAHLGSGADRHGGAHAPHGERGHAFDPPHGSLRGYLTGFLLSVVLTAIPFGLVMTGALPNRQAAGLIIAAFAMTQIVVHIIYFLHMSPRSEGGWNMMALAFTLIIVVIAVAGSVWIMQHLNINMMPEMSALP
jgi:cytochrome o ubiquinol oxidase operon protein cyoD